MHPTLGWNGSLVLCVLCPFQVLSTAHRGHGTGRQVCNHHSPPVEVAEHDGGCLTATAAAQAPGILVSYLQPPGMGWAGACSMAVTCDASRSVDVCLSRRRTVQDVATRHVAKIAKKKRPYYPYFSSILLASLKDPIIYILFFLLSLVLYFLYILNIYIRDIFCSRFYMYVFLL